MKKIIAQLVAIFSGLFVILIAIYAIGVTNSEKTFAVLITILITIVYAFLTNFVFLIISFVYIRKIKDLLLEQPVKSIKIIMLILMGVMFVFDAFAIFSISHLASMRIEFLTRIFVNLLVASIFVFSLPRFILMLLAYKTSTNIVCAGILICCAVACFSSCVSLFSGLFGSLSFTYGFPSIMYVLLSLSAFAVLIVTQPVSSSNVKYSLPTKIVLLALFLAPYDFCLTLLTKTEVIFWILRALVIIGSCAILVWKNKKLKN